MKQIAGLALDIVGFFCLILGHPIVSNGTQMLQFVTEKSQYLIGLRIYRKS
jgi:hypothetical protein